MSIFSIGTSIVWLTADEDKTLSPRIVSLIENPRGW
jgi:hypothetical protein